MDKLSFADFIYRHPTWKGETYTGACFDARWMRHAKNDMWKQYKHYLESGKTLQQFHYGHIIGE